MNSTEALHWLGDVGRLGLSTDSDRTKTTELLRGAKRAAKIASMAHRRGQRGQVIRKGPSWLVRFWVDTADIDPKTMLPIRSRVTRWVAAAEGPEAVGKREAERIAQTEHLAHVHDQNLRPSSAMLLSRFVTQRFEPDYIAMLKRNGQQFYRSLLKRHVLPSLGNQRIRDIRTQDIQQLISQTIRTGLSVQTARHIRNVCSAVFGHAKRCDQWAGDLSDLVDVRMPAMQRRLSHALTFRQVEQLIGALGQGRPAMSMLRGYPRKNPDPDPWTIQQLGILIRLLCLTGLRIGEAMGLRWSALNLTDQDSISGPDNMPPNSLIVRESYVRGQYDTLKTRSSRRIIPLRRDLVDALRWLQGPAPPAPDSPVFAASTGRPIDQHNMMARFVKPAATTLAMPWFGWHCLRHTNATLLDESLSTADRQKVLGHASGAMTTHYTHEDLERTRRALERIGRKRNR